jgi:hypothetical protein
MSQTNYLQIVKSGLQRTAGPYICAISDQSTATWSAQKERPLVRRSFRLGIRSGGDERGSLPRMTWRSCRRDCSIWRRLTKQFSLTGGV